jgi:hypothetical protein
MLIIQVKKEEQKKIKKFEKNSEIFFKRVKEPNPSLSLIFSCANNEVTLTLFAQVTLIYPIQGRGLNVMKLFCT